MDKQNKKIPVDRTIFIGALTMMLVVSAACLAFPDEAIAFANGLRRFVITKFDWFFLGFGVSAFFLCIAIGLGKYGKIRLGGDDAKPAYSFFSWLSMIFFSAIGSSAILWSVCEPLIYVDNPPFGYAPYSLEAYNIAVPYGLFHWGPVAWSFYALAGLAVGYYFLVLRRKNLKISGVLEDLIGERASRGIIGKGIDILTIFATFCTFAPALGLGVPLLTALICRLTGLQDTSQLQVMVLVLWMMIFSISVYRGLDKGIKLLSDINMYLLVIILVCIFLAAGGRYILTASVEETGTLISNFIRMNSYGDVFGGGSFAQDWTVFYWCWWVASVPFMGIFIARVSRGRTIRELVFGIVGAGSAGTMSIFFVLGNYALKLQKSGVVDLAAINAEKGSNYAMMAMLETLPFKEIIIVGVILLYFVFLATCVDSCAFTMGCIASKEMTADSQPQRWNRLTWSVAIAILGVAVLKLGGGINALQTFVIAVGLPAALLTIALVVLFFKWVKGTGGDKIKK
ncbi:MAG: BCCT family transporter [Eubacterium sp.]|nr:BCCT family transporter [Eubacterium sp.]